MKTRVTSSSLAGELLSAVHKTLQTLMHNWGSLVCWGGGAVVGVVGMDYWLRYLRGRKIVFSNWLDTRGKEERRL